MKTYAFPLFMIAALLLFSCMEEPPVSQSSIKIKTISINQNTPSNQVYSFKYYNDLQQLESIWKDGLEICRIDWFSADSLQLTWFEPFDQNPQQDWLISQSNGFLNAIYDRVFIYTNNYDTLLLKYKAIYTSEGLIDSLHEPDQYVPESHSDWVNHAYFFEDGNCTQLQYTYYSIESGSDTTGYITYEYESTLLNNGMIPRQFPYSQFSAYASTALYSDPLYIIHLLGIKCIQPNKNLISKRVRGIYDENYSYQLDSMNRVSFMTIYSEYFRDTMATMEFEYY